MAFGPIMRMKVGELAIELAPIAKEDLTAFISPGMQQASVTRYLGVPGAPVIEDEEDWYAKTRASKDGLTWGIWDVTDDRKRLLIGTTALNSMTKDHTIQATSGSMISNKVYWGKGIASAIHKARTWYGFEHMGLTRIKSAVIHGNIASRKALEKSGYALVYIERNTVFADGELRHQDNLECLNPAESMWNVWWGTDTPTATSLAARDKTREAMKWAKENVTLL
jgi:RimJ/RimL family protein N-acetyltransferase